MNSSALLLLNHAVQASTLPLDLQDLAAQKTLSGTPRVGTAVLGQLGDCTVGVWEMSPSVTTDVEVNEFFIVLSGRGKVSFADGSPDMQLQPGSVGHLKEGAQTTWTITDTLRKIYLIQGH